MNVVVLLALALTAELVFGEWIGSGAPGRLAVPRNLKVVVSAAPLYPGGGEFLYRRDALGFRGPGVDPARIGYLDHRRQHDQSTVPAGRGYVAGGPGALPPPGGPRCDVANAGIDGQSTAGMIADLDFWLLEMPALKPRLVLAYVGINDVYKSGPAKVKKGGREDRRQILRDNLQYSNLTREIEQRSALVRLWTTVAGLIEADRARLRHHAIDFASARWTDQPAQPVWPPDQLKVNLAAYKDRLERIAGLIESMGAIPVFITQTRADYRLEDGRLTGIVETSGPNGVDRGHALTRFNAATLEVCRYRHVACLDLATELPFSEGDFYDYEHNTPQGAEKIGRWLAGKLAGLVSR